MKNFQKSEIYKKFTVNRNQLHTWWQPHLYDERQKDHNSVKKDSPVLGACPTSDN